MPGLGAPAIPKAAAVTVARRPSDGMAGFLGLQMAYIPLFISVARHL